MKKKGLGKYMSIKKLYYQGMIEFFPFLYSFRYFIIFILSKYNSCDQKKTINVMKSKTENFFRGCYSVIGEGNGNPLQYSCLENPGDRGIWWAAIYGLHRVGHDWCNLAAAAVFGCWVISNSLQPHGLQFSRLPCPSLSPWVCSNSCPLSQWYHSTISSSVAPFCSCLQSFPASEFFLMSQPFTSGGQSIAASVSASVLPMNIQGWFPLGLTVLISLLSTATKQWEGLFSWPTSFSH